MRGFLERENGELKFFRSTSMNDKGLKLIVDAITKRFDQLEWLYLNFSR